jgi:hypothetical protein
MAFISRYILSNNALLLVTMRGYWYLKKNATRVLRKIHYLEVDFSLCHCKKKGVR